MSVRVMSWVFDHSPVKLGDRLVLLALADHAGDDGDGAYPGWGRIAEKARMSERQVARCLKNLEAQGQIERTGTSEYGTIVYRIKMEGDNLSGVTNPTRSMHDLSPEPSLEPEPSLSLVHASPVTAKEPRPVAHAREERQLGALRLGKVDRKSVTLDEETLARAVLAEWNLQTGQTLTSKDWLRMFVSRIREHPELELPDHGHLIAAALTDPWWTGNPSPNVVYGNGRVFESVIQNASGNRAPRKEPMRYGRGMTAEAIIQATRGRP